MDGLLFVKQSDDQPRARSASRARTSPSAARSASVRGGEGMSDPWMSSFSEKKVNNKITFSEREKNEVEHYLG